MYRLQRSTRSEKKWMITTPSGKVIHFGQKGASDFTKHRDIERRQRYISRHQARENWGASGKETAGFWSKHLLWNLPSLEESIRDTERRFGIRISH